MLQSLYYAPAKIHLNNGVKVDDIKTSLKSLVDGGSQILQEMKDVGGGRRIASVRDPDGNIIGRTQDRVGDQSIFRAQWAVVPLIYQNDRQTRGGFIDPTEG